MNRILQVFFYSTFSAVIFASAIPNEFLYFGSPVLGLLALVPLYIAISKSPSWKIAGFATSLQFGLTHIFSSFWLGNFGDFAIFTLGASALAYFVAGFFFGQFLYLPFFIANKNTLKDNSHFGAFETPFRILYFACVWTIHEWFKSTGFLAYPWGTVIMTAYKWQAFTQIVSLVGTFGLSFLIATFSATFSEWILQFKKNLKSIPSELKWSTSFIFVLFVLSFVYGIFELNKPRKIEKTFDAAIVQQNSDSWTDDDISITLEKAQDLTRKAVLSNSEAKPDIVFWNEAILPYLLPENYDYYCVYPYNSPIIKEIYDLQIPHLLGAPYLVDEENFKYSNSVVLFDKDGNMENWYAKIHLVPFAEGVPYPDSAIIKALMNAMVGFSSGWTPGKYLTLFEVENKDNKKIKFSAPICFEDAFSDLCRKLYLAGSEVFVNLTNDSWSKTKSAEYQHFVIASYRAIEFRTTLVRSTNSGYSVVVDPVGNIIFDLPLFESTSGVANVPIYERVLTPYAIVGNLIVWLCFGFVFGYILTKRI